MEIFHTVARRPSHLQHGGEKDAQHQCKQAVSDAYGISKSRESLGGWIDNVGNGLPDIQATFRAVRSVIQTDEVISTAPARDMLRNDQFAKALGGGSRGGRRIGHNCKGIDETTGLPLQPEILRSRGVASPPRYTPPVLDLIQKLRANITSVYMGNASAVDRVMTCLLARGHVLIEDVPGVGKTVLAQALSRSLHCTFSRIQCTPDLLPSDITGVSVYQRESGQFEFKRGPIFANFVLADEVNRTTPRTQSALLEAMAEATVSAEGTVHPLPQPFMVVATQNPYEFEGTYFLPENQLDRFLMRVSLGYPSPDDESRILLKQPARTSLRTLEPVMSGDELMALQERVDQVRMDQSLVDYVIALASATRDAEDLQVGVSPRGSLALASAARATAVMHGRDHCIPEDVVSNVLPVCAHRVVSKTYMHSGDSATTRRIIQQVMESIASPA